MGRHLHSILIRQQVSFFTPAVEQLAALPEIIICLWSHCSKHFSCTAARQNTTVQVLAAMRNDHTAHSIISASDSE